MYVVPDRLAPHDDRQLCSQFKEAAPRVTLFVSVFAQPVHRVPRIADKFALEECDVEAGGVVVDKLEQEHLHGQAVLIISLGPWEFEVGDHDGHFLVDRVEDHDDDEANNGSRDGRGHLWGQVLLDWVCPIGVLGERRGEHNEHGQPVDNDPDHRGDDEQDPEEDSARTQGDPDTLPTGGKWDPLLLLMDRNDWSSG